MPAMFGEEERRGVGWNQSSKNPSNNFFYLSATLKTTCMWMWQKCSNDIKNVHLVAFKCWVTKTRYFMRKSLTIFTRTRNQSSKSMIWGIIIRFISWILSIYLYVVHCLDICDELIKLELWDPIGPCAKGLGFWELVYTQGCSKPTFACTHRRTDIQTHTHTKNLVVLLASHSFWTEVGRGKGGGLKGGRGKRKI